MKESILIAKSKTQSTIINLEICKSQIKKKNKKERETGRERGRAEN